MADDKQNSANSRRSFLKIGAGVVVGAVVAGAGVAAYESSVIGSTNSSSSSAVASLSTELSTTQSQLNAAQTSLSSANAQISTLSSQLTSTQGALSNANGTISSLQQQVTSASSAASSAQTQISTVTGFITLSTTEQSLLAAIAETLIPNDGNGPDAAAAGVIYFLDRQLASDYGKSAHMYMQGPFIPPNLTTSITVNDREGNPITYSGGSALVTVESGMQYQYHNNFREFFRYSLDAFETYCNSAYGGDFEDLSATDQVSALTDLYNNKPTTFANIMPSDFFYEVFVMVWSGYFMDPLYGGNTNMAAWSFAGFNGVNMGNFYGEGYTDKQLMLSTTPIRLQPASLGQYQSGSS